MKLMSVFGLLVAFGFSFQVFAGSEAEHEYYKEILSNKAVVQKVHSERNKYLGMTLAEFEIAVVKYFQYRIDSRNSELTIEVSNAAKLAMEHYKTNSPESKKYIKDFVRLQNSEYLEMANKLEIDVISVKHFMEAVAYASYLHKQSKDINKKPIS